MRPWLTNFEQQVKASLLVASHPVQVRYQVEFDTADLLRANPQERLRSYETAIKSGVMSPNEAREREGMPAYAGGEEFSQAWKQTVEVKGNTSEEDK